MQKKILVVDDSASMRQMADFTLSHTEHDILEAVDGLDALNKAEMTRIDLFLVDINMPKLDGISLIKKLRKVPKYFKTPILVLTTESNNSIKMQGKKAGATGWLVKPFQPDQLLKVVEKVLSM